jgi:hypothetical protein
MSAWVERGRGDIFKKCGKKKCERQKKRLNVGFVGMEDQ